MIILSYNSRGLGKGIKWAVIRRLNLKHKVDLVCIQETKKEKFDKTICQPMWGIPLSLGIVFPLSRQLVLCSVCGITQHFMWK